MNLKGEIDVVAGFILILLILVFVIWTVAFYIPWSCEHDGETIKEIIKKKKLQKKSSPTFSIEKVKLDLNIGPNLNVFQNECNKKEPPR